MSHKNEQSHPRQKSGFGPYMGVGVGVLTVSTAAILIRLAQAEAHSLVIAAWRLTLATLVLTPIALATCRSELRTLTRREWISVLVSGLLLALHFATWITSLAYTSVAASVVLVSTNPLFVGLASHLLLRERLSRGMTIALVIATAGSALIGLGDLGMGIHQLWGDVLALLGAMAVAGYFLIGRRLRKRLSLLAYVFPVYGTAALVLMAVMLVAGLPALPQRPQTWLWLLLMALGPQILGHSSLNWALRYLSATYVTIATLGEPIGSALLAWWLLGEQPSPWAVAGGGLILAGLVVASQTERGNTDE
ncbi:MAG: DMT family transporter [Chloroflexota bacterium]|nr:DMT family transporter [Chloroflexota bacterium]